MTEKWTRDTGLVFALLFLILGVKGNSVFLFLSAAFLVALLFVPAVFTPLAWLWLKLTEVLGFVMNRVFFGIVFFLVILPVGMLRRLFKGDARDLNKHPLVASAFVEHEHLVVAEDLTQPY